MEMKKESWLFVSFKFKNKKNEELICTNFVPFENANGLIPEMLRDCIRKNGYEFISRKRII